MEMKTLTVNGQTYTVADPDAAHVDDSVVSDKAWSSKNIVDRMCPTFTESGAEVTCQPVEGYPLQVVSRIEAVQEGSGDPSPDNVRPITGHAAVKLYRGGKNFFDISKVKTPSIEPLVVNNGDGSLTVTEKEYGGVPGSSPNTLRDYAPGLKVGQRYILHAKTTGSKAFIYFQGAGVSWFFGASLTMTEKILDSKVLWYAGANTTATIWDIQIEEGSAATEFEPYRGEDFTVELGQTIYGGSYNWQSGILTVDRAMCTLDGTEVWYSDVTDTSYNGVDTRKRYYLTVDDNAFLENAIFAKESNLVDDKLLCSMLPTITAAGTWMNKDGMSGLYSGSTRAIYVYCDQYATDFEGFKAMMLGAQIVFALKEPITIQLTPQEVLALSGVNTLHSDTGDTILTGKSDPAAVIKKLTNAIIALGGNI